MTSVPRRLLTARELAQHLSVTPRWVYLQVEQHDLPAYRLGGRALRFEGDSARLVLALLAAAATPPTEEGLFQEIEELAGAPVDRAGPVGDALSMLRGAGALAEVPAAAAAGGAGSARPGAIRR